LGKAFLMGIFFLSCLFLFGVQPPVHAQGKTIMVIAPHPDDEALCCAGVIYAAKLAGNTVKVVVVTNGDDYQSPASQSRGFTREAETIAAMTGLGLSSQDVIFLGYGDQALQQLLFSSSPSQVYTSVAGQTKTYANNGLGGVSYHQFLTGSPGSYNQQTVLSDFESVIQNFAPTDIYTTGMWDNHPDHRSTYAFTSQALIALKKQGLLPFTRIHETWIHSPCQDCDSSYTWPEPVFTPDQPFPEPEFISQTPYDWTQIENIPVPAAMQDPNQNTNLKWNTIATYHSQTSDDPSNYLFGFVKITEFFWVRNFQTNVAVLATATASSQTATNLDAASDAIDGIVSGSPNPLNNSGDIVSFTASGGGEWVTQGQLAGAWIKLTWPTSVTTSEVILYARPDGINNIFSGTLTFSDGSSVPVGALPVGGAGLPISFPSKAITWMQFTITGAQGQNTGLSEIEVFGTVTNSTNTFGPQITDGPVASPADLTAGQTSTLTAGTFDVYGYPLTYSWSANGGSFTGSGASVSYDPPAAPGTYTSTVTVTDGHGASTQNSTFLTVSCGICGTISGAGGSGATVTLSGSANSTTTADSSGGFNFDNVANGSYTVTPSLTGYTFSPASRNVTISNSSASAVNFATLTSPTYSISGTVSGGAGTTVALSGAASGTTIADSSGAYSFTGLSNGGYTLTPSLTGDTFNPASQNVTISNANVTANFTAVVLHSITGTINGVGGATVTLSSSGSTVATITSGASGTNYSFANVRDGSYTVTPSLAGYTFAPTSAAVNVSGANATVSAFTATAVAPSFTPIRINGGGPAYTDPQGNVWSADTGFTGGTAASTNSSISNTTTPILYQTERYGAFSYNFPVPSGSYAVTLKFAEIYYTTAGQRIFSVAINGSTVLSNFDIFSQAGGAFKALDKTFNVTPTTGNITIQFITGSADLPKISAIQIAAYSPGVGITMTPATASLSGNQQQLFTPTVTGSSNTAVTWSMNPNVGTLSNGLYTAPATITATQTVTVTATSVADTTQSANSTVTLNPPAGSFAPIRVNGGGPAYTDPQSNVWSADAGFTGGTAASTASAITNTTTPTLYQTERYGAFSYTFPVPSGSYAVTLKFAEIYYTTAGQRIFSVAINGTTVLSNFDIFSQAGGAFKALDKTFNVTPTTGNITIQFITGSADLPKISAIQIVSNSGVGITMTPATASLTGSQQQQFTPTVTGSSNTAVTWSMTPNVGTLTNGLYTAPASITATQTVTVTATSAADTTQSANSTVTLNPPAGTFTPIRVHSGGAAYTDPQSNVWSADTGFTGGTAASTATSVTGTTTPALYQTERYGAFSYTFTAPSGSYAVTLKFAEIYFTTAGQRIFSVAINGSTVLSNFDIFSQAGGAFKALDKTFTVTPTTGNITIQFITGSADLPKISAIQIVPYSGVGITMTPATASLSANQTQQFTPTVTGNSNTAVTWSMNPQVGTLTNGLYTAPATITATQTVVVTATSVADPTQSASSTVTLNPPAGAFTPIRVHSGGAAYTDSQGLVWSADTGFTGGTPASTMATIAGTPDPALYQSERYNVFTYNFTVPNGSHTVTLKFAEIYYTAPGQRIFSVAINGTTVLSNFDIVASAGGANIAYDRAFPVTVTNGTVTLQFIQGSADLPKVSAIQIQ
jgi:LmbE family N-acetylglucosaminyl deacetylase